MHIKKLINKTQKYDLLFLMASDIVLGDIYLDKYYVKEDEYDVFAKGLDSDYDNKGYSYLYLKQKVRLDDFIELFDLTHESATIPNLIDEINQQLKNIAIHCQDDGEYPIEKEYSNRQTVNAYFDNREIIPEKRTERFPLPFGNQFIGNDVPITFRMYNVGQACMSALFIGTNTHPTVIFDLGRSRRCKSAISLLQNDLSYDENIPTTIVISHFDDDHINMAKHLPTNNANLQFFMPQFLHPSDIYKPNIQLLIYKAIINGGKICFFLNDSLNTPLPLGYATFYQGSSSKKDANQSTNENSHGLTVLLNFKGSQIMVPGDILYEDFFTRIVNPLTPNYVVLPHHSCNYLGKINPSIIRLQGVAEAFAFCGPHGGYHHPNKTHFQQYSSCGARLVRLIGKSKKKIVYDRNKSIADTFFYLATGDYYDWVI